ncbi:hypothetical protein LCGC14_1702380, partial [marine sediment metagenome]
MQYLSLRSKICKTVSFLAVIIGFFTIILSINIQEAISSLTDMNPLRTSEIFKGFDWTNEFRGQNSSTSKGIAEDTDGNLYLLVQPTGRQILVKYTSKGDLIWNITLSDMGNDMVIDSANSIYLAGSKNFDIHLIKYDQDGNKEWIRSWDSGLYDRAMDLTLDSLGNIYITGQANYNKLQTGSGDMFVLKYNSSGYLQLNKTWGKANLSDGANSLAIDSSGNIYLAGSYYKAGSKWELVKLNTLGDYQWNFTYGWGGSGSHVCNGVALDSKDNVLLVGYAHSSVRLIKLSPSGGWVWNTTWDNGLNDLGISIAIDSQDNIFIAGTTESGDPNFDYDALFLKYDSDGNQIWNATWERVVEYFMTGYWDDSFLKIFVSSDNDIYLIGTSKIGSNFYIATIAKFENTPSEPPSAFTLITDAETLDTDGSFNLIWTNSIGADNYSVSTTTRRNYFRSIRLIFNTSKSYLQATTRVTRMQYGRGTRRGGWGQGGFAWLWDLDLLHGWW